MRSARGRVAVRTDRDHPPDRRSRRPPRLHRPRRQNMRWRVPATIGFLESHDRYEFFLVWLTLRAFLWLGLRFLASNGVGPEGGSDEKDAWSIPARPGRGGRPLPGRRYRRFHRLSFG